MRSAPIAAGAGTDFVSLFRRSIRARNDETDGEMMDSYYTYTMGESNVTLLEYF